MAFSESFIDWGGHSGAQEYLDAHVTPTILPGDFYGLAMVYREASAFPEIFRREGYIADHIRMVADVPVGNLVFCLPITPVDVGWRPVIIEARYSDHKGQDIRARFAWVHPHCVAPLSGSWSRFMIKVHHTHKRGRKDPTTDIGPVQTGSRVFDSRLVFDARWRAEETYRNLQCTGHCLGVCLGILTDVQFAQIIEFARMLTRHKAGDVCCYRGKHRSVAAANILFLLFRVSVDMTYAAAERCRECCGRKVKDNIHVLLNRLRAFPKLVLTGRMRLADALRL